MRNLTRKRNLFLLPSMLMMALALMFCDPGKSLDPTPAPVTVVVDTGKVAKITLVSAPTSVLPTDTATVSVTISDSANGNAIKGAKLAITSTQFTVLSASANKAFDLDSVPDDGKVTFRIAGTTPGNGSVNVRVTSGAKIRSLSIPVIITEKPVPPKVVETLLPKTVAVKDTAKVEFTIVDSAQEKPLANAVVMVTSATYQVFGPTGKDTLSTDTTGSDGKVAYRIYTETASGAGTIQVKVKTAAGITRAVSYTISITQDSAKERPRKMVFTALRSSLRADGTDSTQLRVLIKDDNNNPLPSEKLTFTATGGVVSASATTDEWGIAYATLKSERVNKTVIVTATLEKTGATAQQSVSFDGVTINILPAKRVLMTDSIDPVVLELRDGGNVPISGDSMEIVALNSYKGFGQKGTDSLVVVTDTKGQYHTSLTSDKAADVILTAKALGAVSADTMTFSNKVLVMEVSKSSIIGDGLDQVTITTTLKNGDKSAIANAQLRWTTTFGSFTTGPFTATDGNGQASITLKAPHGSGMAVVNVEAYSLGGGSPSLVASGNITIPVKALKVARLVLKVTPDNIPVKTGESRLIAQAYDSSNNYMEGVLIGFKMIKGAGGGDETISPPVDYTKAGQAEASFKAGGVISLYRGVKLAAVALDISGTDTLVVASSDTIGLTISGPPNRISVGVNILKGIDPDDGTFALPTAAVVTDVNGNLVADGTPVNFSTIPIAANYPGESWKPSNDWPYYTLGDTVWYSLPWTDYNNNGKLDVGEEPSQFSKTGDRPYRGEDRDGDGIINLPPETFIDLNHNGVWDSENAEPLVQSPSDTSKLAPGFVDFNKNGKRDTVEPFYRNGVLITDLSSGPCKCAGTRDAQGNLYETSYFGSTANHPFPGEASVGIPRSVSTVGGKSTTQVIYVQSLARIMEVRITAESNGIESFVDVVLPIIQSK